MRKTDFARLIRFIRHAKIAFGWTGTDSEAMIIPTRPDPSVTINLTMSIVDSIIHEYLHFVHPSWTESRVAKTAYRFRCKLTKEQAEMLASLAKEGTDVPLD